LLVKIAPDLSDAEIIEVADLVTELGVDGVVAVNTTISHDDGAGGKSGPLLKQRGLQVVELLRSRLGEKPAIIGCGGIETAHDARDYLRAGANLVQGYTGFVYMGPLWAVKINRALTQRPMP
jgi:dihydroorotate dehydrogenase